MLAKGALLTSDGKEVDEEEQETLPTQGKPKVPSKQKGSQEAGVVAQAVLALRSIVQQNPSEQEQVQNVLLIAYNIYHDRCSCSNNRMSD